MTPKSSAERVSNSVSSIFFLTFRKWQRNIYVKGFCPWTVYSIWHPKIYEEAFSTFISTACSSRLSIQGHWPRGQQRGNAYEKGFCSFRSLVLLDFKTIDRGQQRGTVHENGFCLKLSISIDNDIASLKRRQKGLGPTIQYVKWLCDFASLKEGRYCFIYKDGRKATSCNLYSICNITWMNKRFQLSFQQLSIQGHWPRTTER